MRISILNSDKLQAATLALRGFDREMQGQVRRATKLIGQPEWQSAVRGQTSTRMESVVLADTARMQVSNQNVMLKSAAVGRARSGGAKPSQLASGVEFGANPKRATFTGMSKRGKRYRQTRNVHAQFRAPNRQGNAVYPAAAKMIPRFAALWTQTVVRTFYETWERR